MVTGVRTGILDRSASRRRFLTKATGLTLGAAVTALARPSLALAAPGLPATRELAFRSLHTGEELRAAYVRDGALDAEGLRHIHHILRDWRTGDMTEMDRGLLDLLYALRQSLDSDAPFEVISAYRSPKTNAKLAAGSGGVAKRSLHMRGMAIDVRLQGRRLSDLHRAALALKGGGVGLYSKSGFIHVDTGRVRRWGR